MKKAALLLAAALVAATASPAAAQFGKVEAPPKTWVSAWVGGFTNPGRVSDGASDRHWNFGSSFAGGLGAHRRVGSSLVLGLDASFAPAPYELVTRGDEPALAGEGSARVVTAMASGRLRYGGGGSFFMYLTGGAGAMIYGMPELNRWDPDLALLTGAGLEYRPSGDKAIFIEWGRYWTFHQRDQGVSDNSTKHGQLRIGVRTGW